ncbi:S-adenosyl-L-methionine-dependent methyltransferase [Dactylonectria macrodidyma]|uniref:S-adenosyl-L-methionine-dependent methyltransferase n=1 Tax=Dactylonectria macrodidyma TaxID=307937 RepID=A0A9P9JE15_9HYPO|nr:S-adenosyl-L-methionine-dependent methyltransferase [Dactylonectria macrodidyma]
MSLLSRPRPTLRSSGARQLLRPLCQSTRRQSTMTSAQKDTWSANQYSKFLNERTQPSRDLLSRVPLVSPKRIVDLGCGPGNSTAVVAERYPDAKVSGIDSSADMIQKAKETLPEVSFDVVDLTTYKPDGEVDLYFSNAVFQWLPSGRRIEIISQLVEHLSPGGVLAFQVPFNVSEPSHAAMSETAFTPDTPWEETMRRAKPGRDEFPA